MNRDNFLHSATPSRDPSHPSDGNPLLGSSDGLVSDLEQEVLDEYARLLENVNKLSDALANIADSPASLTLDGLRLLERKTATVYTLLKASVYSIVLQQQIINDGEAATGTGHEYQHMEDASVMTTGAGHGGEGNTITR